MRVIKCDVCGKEIAKGEEKLLVMREGPDYMSDGTTYVTTTAWSPTTTNYPATMLAVDVCRPCAEVTKAKITAILRGGK